MASGFTEEFVEVGGAKVQIFKGGSGEPLLVLHGAGGNLGWLRFAQLLAEKFTVYAPFHPGFGKSDRPGWIETIQDLACFYTWFQEEQELEGVRVIGFSMGGWLAAEMAAMCRHSFSKLLLVGAAGIKPQQGEIADLFIIPRTQLPQVLIHDPEQAPEYDALFGHTPSPEELELIERNWEMAARLCWKPYMHDPRLPSLLARVNVPTRLVWGRQDRLIPLECGQLYQKAIPGAELVVIEDCGHLPEVEKPDEFVRTALDFLAN